MAFMKDGIIVGNVGGTFKTFDDYLELKCEQEGGFEGVLDDDMEDAFDRWLQDVDPGMLIQWGNEAVALLSKETLQSQV